MPVGRLASWFPAGLVVAALVAGGCGGTSQVRMTTETDDATRSQCRRDCDARRAECLHKKRDAKKRHEVAGPKEVSRDEWQEVYQKAQEMAKKCEQQHRECVDRCLE